MTLPLRPRALVLGDPEQAELRALWPALEREFDLDSARWDGFAPESCATEPDLLILGQSWPGAGDAQLVATCQRAWPLVRVVRLAGSWAANEARTYGAWPSTTRWDLGQARAILRDEARRRVAGLGPSWARAVTAGLEDETFSRPLRQESEGQKPRSQIFVVGIVSQEPASAELLASICRGQGFAPLGVPASAIAAISGLDAVLWDLPGEGPTAEQRATWSRVAARAALVILKNFPRFEDHESAAECGAFALLGKPFALVELEATLNAARTSRSECCVMPSTLG